MSNSNPLSIKEIKTEKLFGFYNYDIPSTKSDISKLLIIYGDNGSGKTTLLRIIFYLFSIRDKSGFKSKLAKIKFKSICIKLENDIEIGAIRDDINSFSYNYYIKTENGAKKSVLLKANDEGDIKIPNQSKEDQETYNFIINYLKELKIHTSYLSDDRKIHNSITSKVGEDDFINLDLTSLKVSDYENYKRKIDNKNNSTIKPAIEKLLNWIQNKAIVGSRIGEKASQIIFSDLINNYINLANSENVAKSKNEIISELDEIERKIPSYAKLGLIENFETKSLRASIKKAKTNEQLKYLSSIITPFLEGMDAKLKAIEKVEQIVNLLISIINDYFSHKQISFNLTSGFTLTQAGIPIDFDWLSSGEKQLLLLLINIISSSDEATVFIIDEPEISLNIKWQRKLIPTLLAFSQDKNIQFIIATHSLELLSANRTNVSKLENKKDER